MKQSQQQAILNYLERGNSITPISALKKFGSFRLGARIHNLKQQGYQIERKMITRNGKRFASYKLA